MKEQILKRLENLFQNKLGVTIKKEHYGEHLFGQKINLNPRHLVYIFFFIREEFNIYIDNKHIINGSFSTINNIVCIIYEALQANKKEVVT